MFFVDGIAFLLTLSCQIKLLTVEHTPRHTAKQLNMHLKHVLQVYYHVGFSVRYILMDSEFKKMKNELPSIVCNTSAAKERVVEAECQIRVVKER